MTRMKKSLFNVYVRIAWKANSFPCHPERSEGS